MMHIYTCIKSLETEKFEHCIIKLLSNKIDKI